MYCTAYVHSSTYRYIANALCLCFREGNEISTAFLSFDDFAQQKVYFIVKGMEETTTANTLLTRSWFIFGPEPHSSSLRTMRADSSITAKHAAVVAPAKKRCVCIATPSAVHSPPSLYLLTRYSQFLSPPIQLRFKIIVVDAPEPFAKAGPISGHSCCHYRYCTREGKA